MKRRIIKIDQNRCNGCGLCAQACHEGAIQMIDGKATLVRDDYCDGLGDCLPACPTQAISFEVRETAAYDEKAVHENLRQQGKPIMPSSGLSGTEHSELLQWPVQIQLAPVNAPFFQNAHLLIAADCTAYAYGDFHRDFVHNRKVLIGCPKLDEGDYTEKLTEIIRQNDIKSLTIVRMQVPCCGGLEHAAVNALKASGKFIPWQVKVIATDGSLVE